MATTAEPAGLPPLGLKPDIDSPSPIFPFIVATVVLCSVLTTVFTAARLVTKRLVSECDIEDYVLIAAWVASIAYDFLLLAAGLAGLGHHIWDIPTTEFPKLAQFAWALEILYTPAIWLAKASLLFQLIRIFTPMKSGLVYWACHALIWGNLAFYVSILFTLIFECHPIKAVWAQFYGNQCINRNMVLLVSGAVNVFSDFLNILLPIWATWHLQMAPKRKAGIIAVFATGLLAFVSSICRLFYTTKLNEPDTDVSYIIAQTGLWALAEVASIILCICFPMMPRLVKLISDHRIRHKSPSASTSEITPKRKPAKGLKASISHDVWDTGSHTEDLARLKSPYERLGEATNEPSGQEARVGRMGIRKTVDIELASWDGHIAEKGRTSIV